VTRLMVLVEGQTEQTFCEELLWPRLDGYDDKRVTKLDPSGSQQGRGARGGHAHRFRIIERDLQRVLHGGFDVVTTMIDLYHLPADFPGLDAAARIPDPIDRARHLEAALHAHMGAPRQLVPNLVVHEFEALLFASPEVLGRTAYLVPAVRTEMSAVARAFPTPEHVDGDDPPGKRLELRTRFHGGTYAKPLQGNLIALEVGLDAMCARCQHFDAWVAELSRRATRA
jgi:hypothetical protein